MCLWWEIILQVTAGGTQLQYLKQPILQRRGKLTSPMKLLNPFSCLVSWVLPAVLQRMQLQGKTASCYTEGNREKIRGWGIRAGREKHRVGRGEKRGTRVHSPRVVGVHRGRLNLLFLARFLRSCLMEGWIPSPQQWKAKTVKLVSIILATRSFIKSLLKEPYKHITNVQVLSNNSPHGMPSVWHAKVCALVSTDNFLTLSSVISEQRSQLLAAQIFTQPAFPRKILVLSWLLTMRLQRN